MMQLPTVDLPLPDSPTSPSISPGAIVSETPSTAWTVPPPPSSCEPDVEVLDEIARPREPASVASFAPPGWKHATRWPGPDLAQLGHLRARELVRARAAVGERARRRAARAATGTRPGISAQPPSAAAPGRGIAPSRPIVYGCCGCANSSCTGASSTLRPAYMTSTRSAMSATTPRLWVISTIAVPSRSRMSRIRSRIPAWIVTSSAVVGSSATSIFGSHASAIAIITRCRIPPESWCGYSSTRPLGRGDAERGRAARSRAVARAGRERSRCRSQHLRDLPADRERRVERRHRLLEDERDLAAADPPQLRRASAESRSTPSKHGAARRRRRSSGSSRSSAISLTLLPQPDSPTMPSTSPSSSANESRRRPATTPSSVSKRTVSASTSSSAHHAGRPRVEDVAQPVAEQVERERAEEDREPGIDGEPRRRREVAPARRRASRPTTASAAGRRARGTRAPPRR